MNMEDLRWAIQQRWLSWALVQQFSIEILPTNFRSATLELGRERLI